MPSRNRVEDLAWLVDYREGGSEIKVSLTRGLGGLQWFTKECGLGIDVYSVDPVHQGNRRRANVIHKIDRRRTYGPILVGKIDHNKETDLLCAANSERHDTNVPAGPA